jgi:hypothetical protein
MPEYASGPDSSKINPSGFPGLLFVIVVVVGTLSLFPPVEALVGLGVILAVSAIGAVLLYRYRSRSSD